MPSPYSSDHSITDAKQLAQNLGIKTQTVPIEPVMKSYDLSLAEIFSGTEFGIAEENLQSRIRGTLLMGISNKFNYLLITTGNKSAIAANTPFISPYNVQYPTAISDLFPVVINK